MSQSISPSTGVQYGLKRVCLVWDIARSTFYLKKRTPCRNQRTRSGPKPALSDEDLLTKIKEDINSSPFKGEGHRKIHARLKRRQISVGRNRVLKVMRKHNLLSPHRARFVPSNKHDGKIITEAPNAMWCSDGLKVRTVDDGWIWLFSVEEHWNAECLGWHVCKKGDRFAALEAVTQAVKKIYGATGKGIATGLKLRIDNGTQYTSDYFLKQIAYLGIQDSFGLVRQPQTNGVAERFNRTLREQVFDGQVFQNADEVRQAVAQFVRKYNEHWLVGKLGYQSPTEARRNYFKARGAA